MELLRCLTALHLNNISSKATNPTRCWKMVAPNGLSQQSIGGLGYFLTKNSVEDLQEQYLQAVLEGVAKGIDALTQPAFPLLSSIDVPEDLKAEIGVHELELVRELASHIKNITELTYLNYGDQKTGHYVAIRRDESGRPWQGKNSVFMKMQQVKKCCDDVKFLEKLHLLLHGMGHSIL